MASIQNVLITGSNGFTGRHMTQLASQAGYQCFGLQRQAVTDSEINVITADLLKPQSLTDALKNIDIHYVIHLAAVSFVGHKNIAGFYENNLLATLHLLEAIKATQKKIVKIIVASSANIYGETDQLPICEGQQPSPQNDYAASKVTMEVMLQQRFKELPIIVCRPFNYTGVGQQEHFLIPKIFGAHARKSETLELGNLDVARDYSDVRDVCRAYLMLMQSGIQSETFNICSGISTSLQSLVERISALSAHKLKIKINQAFVRKNEIKDLYGDDSKLHHHIGDYRHFSLDDTLSWMWQEYYSSE